MATDVDAYRGMNYEIAEAIAPTWARRSDNIEAIAAPVREWMLRELDPQPGQTVLELAAGVGETGFEAATRLGERGRLISSDFSPTMLAAARSRGAELGVENVEYRVIDAERIDLADDHVDGLVCRFGFMLMADPAAALAESRRVLRAGGRLTLAVWGAPERNPFFTAAVMALVQRGHVPPPDPQAPGLFSMASPQRTQELLSAAGFAEVRTEEVPVQFEVPTAAEYVNVIADTAGSIGLAVRGLPDDERAAIAKQAEAAFERFAGADGYRIPGVAVCAVAS